jgi:hypothetical protein
VSAHELRRRAFRSLAHLVPQGDRGIRVVTGAGGQFEADQVGLVFIGAAVGQGHAVVGHGVGQRQAVLAQTEQGTGALLGHFDAIGLGHRFATVLAQGVGDFMAHDRGDFVVGQLQAVDQARVENDLAARAAVGVELIALDQIDFPLPLRRIRAETPEPGRSADWQSPEPLGIGLVLSSTPLLDARRRSSDKTGRTSGRPHRWTAC